MGSIHAVVFREHLCARPCPGRLPPTWEQSRKHPAFWEAASPGGLRQTNEQVSMWYGSGGESPADKQVRGQGGAVLSRAPASEKTSEQSPG